MKKNAFTLIEVLVAVGIFSLVIPRSDFLHQPKLQL